MTATIVVVTIMLEAIPVILQLLAVARPIYLLLLPFAACVQKTDTPPTIRSRACARLGRYELMLTINPLLVVGGTGPPANTVAFF